MTNTNFYRLSRAVQDNLLDSLGGRFAPVPILVRLGPKRSVATWLAVSAAAAVALVWLFSAGFGGLLSSLSLQPLELAAVYALLVATIVVGILNALACRARIQVLPFRPGLFLFPANLIDAREHVLRVYPLEELSSVSAGAGGIVLQFGSKRFSLPLPDGTSAQQAIEVIEKARDRVRAPLDAKERREIDPLAPPSVVNPLVPQVPWSRTAPLWERHRVALAAVTGAVIGGGLFFARNAMSDARMFATARARDDVATYRAYLVRGRSQRDQVARILLPRAALRIAIGKGGVANVDAFIREFPSTGIQGEVDAARKSALYAEFELARKTATFDSVLSFADRYPDHGVGPAYDQARHFLYTRALERYRAKMPDPPEDLLPKLVAYAERVGPRKTPDGFRGLTVQVRFRQLPSQNMDRAEPLVTKSPTFDGPSSLPARYLGPERMTPHEQATAKGLVEGLAGAFNPEIATFEPGPPVEGTDEELPDMTTPTVVVTYRIEPSGSAYSSTRPRGIFMGLRFHIRTEFFIPGEKAPLRLKQTMNQPIPTDLVKQYTDPVPRGTVEAAVYEAMSREAFAEFQKRLLARFTTN